MALLIAAIPIGASAADDLPQVKGKLVRVPDSRAAIAYVRPNTDWAKYKSICFLTLAIPPEVRDASPPGARTHLGESYVLGDKEVSAIQKAYRDTMSEVFRDAGKRVVPAPQADTLIVASHLMDIRLNAPIERTRRSYQGRGMTITEGAGSMQIATLLADGVSEVVLAELADRSYPQDMWRSNNRASNMAEARRAFKKWGRELRDGLAERGALR